MGGDSLQKYGGHKGHCRPVGAAWRTERGARKGRGGLGGRRPCERKSVSGDLNYSAAKKDESDHSEQDKRGSRRLEPGCFAGCFHSL